MMYVQHPILPHTLATRINNSLSSQFLNSYSIYTTKDMKKMVQAASYISHLKYTEKYKLNDPYSRSFYLSCSRKTWRSLQLYCSSECICMNCPSSRLHLWDVPHNCSQHVWLEKTRRRKWKMQSARRLLVSAPLHLQMILLDPLSYFPSVTLLGACSTKQIRRW